MTPDLQGEWTLNSLQLSSFYLICYYSIVVLLGTRKSFNEYQSQFSWSDTKTSHLDVVNNLIKIS